MPLKTFITRHTHQPKMKNSCQTEIYFLQIEMRNANDVKDVADDDDDDDDDEDTVQQQQNWWDWGKKKERKNEKKKKRNAEMESYFSNLKWIRFLFIVILSYIIIISGKCVLYTRHFWLLSKTPRRTRIR